MAFASRAIICVVLCAIVGCRSSSRGSGGGGLATSRDVPDQQEAQRPAPGPSTSPPPAAVPAAPRPVVDDVAPENLKYTELSTRFGPGEVVDLGPAASVSATKAGAVFITKDDEVVLAKRQGKLGFLPITLGAERFSKYGWGPSVSDSHVYWSSLSGRLMRASLKTLIPEVLFEKARPSTRTAVQSAAGRDVVAFIAELEERSFAYVWASKGLGEAEVLDASADGHGATSVNLVHGTPHPRLVVLEGRTSMSPIHSRVVRVTPRRMLLEPNEIVWIGPGSHDLTEIHAIAGQAGSTVVFLPTQKDFHDFGLAQLLIKKDGGESNEPQWQVYPNGLDPAPVATAHFCQEDYVIFARPSEKRPHSPQQLHIAQLDQTGPKEGEVIVRSRAFNDVSIAPLDKGAILVWTADKRSWGMILHCPQG